MTKHTVARVEDMIATEDDSEVSGMLREYATLLTEKENNETTHWNGTTHYAGCIQAGPKHYECALQEIAKRWHTLLSEGVDKNEGWADKRPWVGLTDEEFHDLQIEHGDDLWANFKTIEAKLKEKNGG